MKNKNYTILITTDKNDHTKMLHVSLLRVKVGMFFGIAIIFLAIFGVFALYSDGGLIQSVQLKSSNARMLQLIEDLDFAGLIDSSHSVEKFIEQKEFSGYPQTPPVVGYITKGLISEGEKYHPGVDIAAQYGDDILAPANGLVVFSGETIDLGNMLILYHGDEFFTVFGHNDTNFVSMRDHVTRGQTIAQVGASGVSGGPHLHFEIWKRDRVLDPREIIKEYKGKDVSIRQK